MNNNKTNQLFPLTPLKRSILLALALSSVSALATAETIQVTASPIIEENQIDAFSSFSSVITDEQVRDQNALDLASALRRTPGVQITRFNPVGSFGGNEGGGVFVRGMGVSRPGSEIKTYIDDIPFYMSVWGHPLLDLLPLNGMKSLTVYKSPQPHINGNNFASINLVTKSAEEDGLHGSTRVSGGMHGTFSEQADLVGRYGDVDFMLAQGYATSDGHRDHANGELSNIMGKLNYRLSNHWSVGTTFLYTKNTSDDPGDNREAAPAVTPEYETEAGMLTLSLSHEYENVRGHLKFYYTAGEGNWLDHPNNKNDPRITDTYSDFDSYGLRWQEQMLPWKDGVLTVGLDSDWISGDVKDPVGNPSGENGLPTFRVTSPYISVSQTIALNDEWSLVPSAGIRYYDHNLYESKTSPHAGLSLVSENFTVYANISKGINYPGLEVATLSKYIPPLSSSFSSLDPAEVEHREIGFKAWLTDSTEVNVSFFKDKFKNRYVIDFSSGFAAAELVNFGQYTMRGSEISVSHQINDQWSLFGGLTLLDPNIKGLPYTPDRAFSAGVNGVLAGINIAVDAQYQSETTSSTRERELGAVNTDAVDSFVVVNARASYPVPSLGKKGEVFVSIENLTNKGYSYRAGYPMPGIWGQVGFSADF